MSRAGTEPALRYVSVCLKKVKERGTSRDGCARLSGYSSVEHVKSLISSNESLIPFRRRASATWLRGPRALLRGGEPFSHSTGSRSAVG